MATRKISELPAAGPLDFAELAPLVQGGQTVHAPLSALRMGLVADDDERLRIPLTPGGRLSVAANDPAPAVASGAALYYLPYAHRGVALWDGATWKRYTVPTAGVVLATTSLAPGNYDVYLAWTGTELVLAPVAWASDTARSATAFPVAAGAGWVQNTEAGRLFVGTIRCQAGVIADTPAQRFVWNAAHRLPRVLATDPSTANWTYSAATWREANGGVLPASTRVQWLAGEAGVPVVLVGTLVASSSAAGTIASTGIGLNSASTNSAGLVDAQGTGANLLMTSSARLAAAGSLGLNTAYLLEQAQAVGTTTRHLGLSSLPARGGLTGTLWV